MEENQNQGNPTRYKEPRKKAPWIIAAVAVVVAAVLLAESLVVTEENEYTLIRQFGKVEKILTSSGISLKVPFIQSSSTIPKEMLFYDMKSSDVITKDKKTMVANCYVLWRITDPLMFVQSLNSQVANAENRINTTVYNSIKNVISSMEQAEVISGRDGALREAIMGNIGNTMNQYGITLVSVETKQLDLPSDNKSAVYERMISERNNIAASYTAEGESEAKMIRTATDNEITVSISEAEAKSESIIADGEAEYMRILSAAYSDEARSEFYTFVRSLDAAKSSMTGDKTIILSSDSPLAQIFNTIE